MVNFPRRTVSTLRRMRFADVGMGKRAPRTERKLQTDRDTCRPDLREHAIRLLLSPASWRSYTILTGQWDGMVRSTSQMIQVPSITIRNSKWTRENPYQDIPILNFKPEVWRKVEDAKITVGAAPFAPSELGRNNRYVFALPARLTSGSANGYQGVSAISSRPYIPLRCTSSCRRRTSARPSPSYA
jgi:hypothetical protein